MRLMNLDEEQEDLSIPKMDYVCIVRMPSTKFTRICRNLKQFGEKMVISCAQGGKQCINLTSLSLFNCDHSGLHRMIECNSR